MKQKTTLRNRIVSTTIGEKVLSDQQFRSVLIAGGSMGWNLLYGILTERFGSVTIKS